MTGTELEENRELLKKRLEETENRIVSLKNRIWQLEEEKTKAMVERDEIKDELTCHARLRIVNVVYRCGLEIGHSGGHSFKVGANAYTVTDGDYDEDEYDEEAEF